MKSWLWLGAAAAALAAGGVQAQPADRTHWILFGDDHEGRYYYDPATVERLGGMIRFRMRAVPDARGGERFASAIIQVELNCGEQSTRFLGVETFDRQGGRLESFTDSLARPERIRGASPDENIYRRLCPRSLVRPIPAPPPIYTVAPMAPPVPPAPPAPMPPPIVRLAPPAAPPAVRAQWRMAPSAYIGGDDYPASALRAEAEGRVAVRLAVSADGRVIGCVVTASSGSSALDSTTCSLFQRRARFTPARNAEGQAVPDQVETSIVWSIEPAPPPAVEPPVDGAPPAQPPPEQS